MRFASEVVIWNTQYINVIKSNINTQKKCVSKTSQKICSFRRLQFLVAKKSSHGNKKNKKVQPNWSSFAKTTWYFCFLTFLGPETHKFSVWWDVRLVAFLVPGFGEGVQFSSVPKWNGWTKRQQRTWHVAPYSKLTLQQAAESVASIHSDWWLSSSKNTFTLLVYNGRSSARVTRFQTSQSKLSIFGNKKVAALSNPADYVALACWVQ